jgi:hypothetical protein
MRGACSGGEAESPSNTNPPKEAVPTKSVYLIFAVREAGHASRSRLQANFEKS